MYRVIYAKHFLAQCKLLARRYPHIQNDMQVACVAFRKESSQYLGAKLYKQRVKSSDMRKGKRGGFRIILLLAETAGALVPVTMYAKSDQENISEKELEYHMAMIMFELRGKIER